MEIFREPAPDGVDVAAGSTPVFDSISLLFLFLVVEMSLLNTAGAAPSFVPVIALLTELVLPSATTDLTTGLESLLSNTIGVYVRLSFFSTPLVGLSLLVWSIGESSCCCNRFCRWSCFSRMISE